MQPCPESPGGPNLLDPASPGSPAFALVHNDSESYIPQLSPRMNEPAGNQDIISNDEENSNSNRRHEMDNNSSSAQPPSSTYEDSNSNTIHSINEESLMSLPETNVRRSDHTGEPPTKIRKIASPEKDTDGETCPICLNLWGNTEEHKLVALKCGHLFGSLCVERWLLAQEANNRSCPTCRSKADLKDVRPIYARRVVAADTLQTTQLQKQMDLLKAEQNRAMLELQKFVKARRACTLQLEVFRSTLTKSQVSKEQPVRKSWRFALEKNLEVSTDGGCRVLTYNCSTNELYVSQKSTNIFFPGYGIRKFSCVDNEFGQYLHLHRNPINDIIYSQPRDLLLSVSLDSSATIVERGIPRAKIQSGYPLWSCSWDYLRSTDFYVGGDGGLIQHYDIRNPSSYIQFLINANDVSPVVSLCSTEYGLLSCQLNSCFLFLSNTMHWEPRRLPIEGPFMSLCYDNDSHRALVSCRPNNSERSRLNLCKLGASAPSGGILFNIEETFQGSATSSLMSRPTWVKTSDSSWVASYSESDSKLYLHGLDGARTISLPAAEPALDMCSVQLNGDTIVAALSESRLRLYKSVAISS